FQPFHNGHLEYLLAALEQCETLIVGITNPDPTQISQEPESEHRHRPDSNPFTFFQRLLMIRQLALELDVPSERVIFVPFPINFPDRWHYYVPSDVVHYIRVFSPWEQAKVERLRSFGYAVEVLHEGIAKEVEATEIRQRMANGERWQELVPAAVARVIGEIREGA
ncbi:MAG: adenylyltransferase/cytidyltransferase family protein, partial [Dehalococcoidia bacterium]